MRIYSFAPEEHYHLYNRGVDKRKIFIDQGDHERFVKLLFFCNGTKAVKMSRITKNLSFKEYAHKRGERLVDIGAYCLMPNHFHLLLRENTTKGISFFMQKLMTAYTMYFNTKYERKGRLFESSFRSTHANYDQYLKYLFAYIHLNPLKLIDSQWREKGLYNQEKSINSLADYSFSSLPDYSGHSREESFILNREKFPEYFTNSLDFKSYIKDWMNYAEV